MKLPPENRGKSSSLWVWKYNSLQYWDMVLCHISQDVVFWIHCTTYKTEQEKLFQVLFLKWGWLGKCTAIHHLSFLDFCEVSGCGVSLCSLCKQHERQPRVKGWRPWLIAKPKVWCERRGRNGQSRHFHNQAAWYCTQIHHVHVSRCFLRQQHKPVSGKWTQQLPKFFQFLLSIYSLHSADHVGTPSSFFSSRKDGNAVSKKHKIREILPLGWRKMRHSFNMKYNQ